MRKKRAMLAPDVMFNILRDKAGTHPAVLRREFVQNIIHSRHFGSRFFRVKLYNSRRFAGTTVTSLKSRLLGISRHGVTVYSSSFTPLVTYPLYRVLHYSKAGNKFSITLLSSDHGEIELVGKTFTTASTTKSTSFYAISSSIHHLFACLQFYLDCFDFVLSTPDLEPTAPPKTEDERTARNVDRLSKRAATLAARSSLSPASSLSSSSPLSSSSSSSLLLYSGAPKDRSYLDYDDNS